MIDNSKIKPSNNQGAERYLLGCMMCQPSAAAGVMEFGIVPEDFFDERHKALFELFRDLLNEGKPLDLVIVSEKADDLQLVMELFEEVVSGANWRYYCELLRDKTKVRRALVAGLRLVESACNPSLEQDIERIASDCCKSVTEGFKPNLQDETLEQQLDQLVAELERQDPPEIFSYGLKELDDLLCGGVRRGEVAVVGADTGEGKSILLGMAALANILVGRSVLFFSLEMPAISVLKRLGSNLVSRPLKGVLENPTDADLDAACKAYHGLTGKPLRLYTNVTDIREIEHKVGKVKPDLVIVDYVQLVSCEEGQNKEQQISTICRKFKNISLQHNCAVLSASQITRVLGETHLRESRAISHHADIVLKINNDEEETRICVDKNRRGARHLSVEVVMRGDISRFEYQSSGYPPIMPSRGIVAQKKGKLEFQVYP